jgi:hypothetical protein
MFIIIIIWGSGVGGEGGSGGGNHGRNRIVVLFISTYICNRYISQQMLGNL